MPNSRAISTSSFNTSLLSLSLSLSLCLLLSVSFSLSSPQRSTTGSGGGQSSVDSRDGHGGQHWEHGGQSGPNGSGAEPVRPGGPAQQEAAQGRLLLPQLQRWRGQVRVCLCLFVRERGREREGIDKERGLKDDKERNNAFCPAASALR